MWKKAWIFPYISDYRLNADINFCATAFGFGATVPLVSIEIPLLTVGQSRVALDFINKAEDFVPLAYFGAKELTLPTHTKEMYYQDMVVGDLGSTSFATNLFTYQFSNPIFAWNEAKGKVIVTPADKQFEASTEMTITYNNERKQKQFCCAVRSTTHGTQQKRSFWLWIYLCSLSPRLFS